MLAFVRGASVACFRDRFWLWRSLVGASSIAACSFPKYEFAAVASGGGAGFAGFSGTAAGLGAGASSGAGSGGMAGADAVGGGLTACPPSGGAGGAPALAGHCSNGMKDGDETGADCGGPVCGTCFHSEGCQHNTDCISGECTAARTCAPLFDLQFKTAVTARNTHTLQFLLKLTYLETTPVQLKDLAVRYYFARGDVADPVVPYATQASLNGTSIASPTEWSIVRVLPDAVALADSYLEVTFTSTKVLLQNDVVELSQSIGDGSAAGRPFDQNTHYSYQNVTAYTAEETATIYRQGKLAWGKPPPYTLPGQCFYTAVNFAGDAFTAYGLDFQAGTAALVQFGGGVFHAGTGMMALSPTPDPAYVSMLGSAIVLDTASATLRVPNGSYWFYPYLVSADGANTADLLVQGVVLDTFSAESLGGAPAWAKLGPYPVAVSNGKIVLASSGGALRVAGAELYQAAR